MKDDAARFAFKGLDSLWIAYGVGHFGKSLMWHSSELLFAFYLTEVCGMAPRMMAAIVASSLFASGLMDIFVGHVLRARARSVEAAAIAQSLGACGAGIAFFIFLTIAFLPGGQQVILAMVVGLTFRLAYAFYDVPQNAILGLAVGGTRLRANLSALRFICSGLASLVIAGAAAMLLTNTPRTGSFAILGAAIGITAIATSLWFRRSARMNAASQSRLPHCAAQPETAGMTTARAGRVILQLLCLSFVVGTASAVFMKLEPYFAAAAFTTTAARGTLMGAVACGGILSQLFATWGVARWQMYSTFRLCAAALGIGAVAFVTVGTNSVAGASAAGFLVGFGLNGLGMLLWTAAANLTAALATSPTRAVPTMVFGLLTCSQKTASALGILLIGTTLDWRDSMVDAADPLFAIMLVMGLAPLLGALVCLICAGGLSVPLQPSTAPANTLH